MNELLNEFRLYLAEKLMTVQLWLAPRSPEGDTLVRWLRDYNKAKAAEWERK